MTEDIYTKIWALSPYVEDPESYHELTKLTSALIEQYDLQGRLSHDPFNPTWERVLSLPLKEITDLLMGSTCLVTGGLGCVGSALVNQLLKFDIKAIIIIDIRTDEPYSNHKNVVIHQCDIRNRQAVKEIFNWYRPDFVFHTAAQRDPGLAEVNIVETVSTNVVGTMNIVKACEAVGSVKQLVSSSTGKASRYITEEVYAGTKKILEFILDAYAKTSNIRYSMTRCTHILDNSLMNEELRNSSNNDHYVSIHSPGKFVTAQNATEAALLLLNGLIYSEAKQCNFLLVRHLEWPVESLEVALYYIKQSRRAMPVIFVGNPMGYSEKFFRGQLDWSRPAELNLLINVYERKHRRLNKEEDIIISRPCSTNRHTLAKVLATLEEVSNEREAKSALQEGLRAIVKTSLRTVDPKDTSDILHWGLEPSFLELEHAQVSDFRSIVSLLEESFENSEYEKELMHHQHAAQ